jgi:DNA-binding GntR family transcriptional regulator
MRISIGIAWLVIVAAEMLVGGTGIGYFVWNEWNNLSITNVITAILFIGLVGMAPAGLKQRTPLESPPKPRTPVWPMLTGDARYANDPTLVGEMSVLPVTDALRRLEADGLVESRARSGTRVRVPSDVDIRALYELREALESQSARLFAQKATPAERRELKGLARRVDALFNRLRSSGDDPAFRFTVHSQHVRLHMFIAQHAHSRLLSEMIERNHVLILNWLFDVGARRTPLPSDFHTTLVKALVSGDPEAADTAMRGHIRYGLAEITGNFDALQAPEWRERKRTKE